MIGPAPRQQVRERAAETYEYCGLRQFESAVLTFHVEHVIPRKHGGTDNADNLALACHHCNLHKGPNLTGIDPASGLVTLLYNPRVQAWHDHFTPVHGRVEGRTPTGRATVLVLKMNEPLRVELRQSLRRIE